jgi:hypothetical protein
MRELIARGIPGPQSPTWNATSVRIILNNETYVTGVWHWGKRQSAAPPPHAKLRRKGTRHRIKSTYRATPKAKWVGVPIPGGALVTRELWDRAHATLARASKVAHGRPAKPERVNVLKSMVVCARCGKAVILHGSGRNWNRRWYACCNRDRATGKQLCNAGGCMVHSLENAIWHAVMSADYAALARDHAAEIAERADTGDLDAATAQAAKLTRQIGVALDRELAEENDTVRALYTARITALKAQLETLQSRIAMMQVEARNLEIDLKAIERNIRAARRTTDPTERRDVLLEMRARIEYADHEATVTVEVPAVGGSGNCKTGEPVTRTGSGPATGDRDPARHRRRPDASPVTARHRGSACRSCGRSCRAIIRPVGR